MSFLLMVVMQAGAMPPPPPPPPPSLPQVRQERPAKPTGNFGAWVTTDDYPPEALRNRIEADSDVTVTVDADGKFSNCSARGESEILNEASCTLMFKRATFEPARDAYGKPTRGTWRRTVRWRIPKS